MKEFKTIELTQEQIDGIAVNSPCEYWITVGAKTYNEDKTVKDVAYFLHGRTREPITKEGIEGLGFKIIGFDEEDDFIQFEKGDYCIESNNDLSVFYIEGEVDTVFRGKLETMEELKSVLKWTGVL